MNTRAVGKAPPLAGRSCRRVECFLSKYDEAAVNPDARLSKAAAGHRPTLDIGITGAASLPARWHLSAGPQSQLSSASTQRRGYWCLGLKEARRASDKTQPKLKLR